MNLECIRLQNYRRFKRFEIHFHPELTVIAARNGHGKTTVLEAIAAALGPFTGAFDLGRSEHIRRSDARYSATSGSYENEQNFPVVIDAALESPEISWQRALLSSKGRTTTKEASPLSNWGKELQKDIREGAEVVLPVLRYYSSKRLWVSHKNVASKAVLTESRTAGYEDCLSSLSSFVQLQEWMKRASLAVIQHGIQPGYEGSNLRDRLKGIANAVDTVLAVQGWRHFHYSLVFEELAMVHKEHGALPISLLSDGVRAMISLVADLALRCVRLNSHLGELAPRESAGIVLIDEVDLHLHPAWQQTVIASLREAFPKFQLIVTSHSPQVLSTVGSDSIRLVFQDESEAWHSHKPQHEVLGLESSVALNDIMGVNPVPPVDEAQLVADYIALIEDGKFDSKSGLEIRTKLISTYGTHHSVLRDADRLIRFQAFKIRQNSDNKKDF